MWLFSTYKAFRRWQKLVMWAGLFFIFYTIFGFFILPQIIQKVSVNKLTEVLARQVSISKIKFNPYSLILTIEDFNIHEKNSDKHFFSFNSVMLNLQTSSIFRLGPVIREVNITGLFLNAIRNKDQTYNFSDLIPSKLVNNDQVELKEDLKPSKPLKFSISNIVLNNGKIIINDLPKDKIHAFTEMEIAIPFISSLNTHMDIFVTPHFSVNFNGSPIAIEGETKPFTSSQTTKMDLDLKGIDLKTYYDYIPFKTNIDLKSGTMDLLCSIEFSQIKDQETLPQVFLSGQVNLFKFEINDLETNPLFKMKELSLSIVRSEILKGDMNIKKLLVSSPNISLSLNNANQLNIYGLLPETNPEKKADSKKSNEKKPFPVQLNCAKVTIDDALVTLMDVSDKKDIFTLQNFAIENIELTTKNQLVNIGKISALNGNLNVYRLKNNLVNLESLLPPQKNISEPKLKSDSDKETSSTWNAKIANIELKGFSITANDLISKDKGQALIKNLTLNSKNFSNLLEEKSDNNLSFQVNKNGIIDISGKMGINPLTADLALNAEQIHIPEFQPFISEYLNLIILKGKFSTAGKFSMEKPNKEPLKAKYQGNLNIIEFLAVDSQKTKELIKFNNFGIKGMKLDASPISASVNTITIKEPTLNVAIYSDGSLNFSKIAKTSIQNEGKSGKNKQTKTETMEKPKDSSIPVKISHVIMEKGQVVFNDKSVTPNFKTKLTRINAKITGLSSEEAIQSDILVKALVNNHTPIEIKGKINPLQTDFFCDMIVACSDMDLGYLSPYSGKYAGYKIQKGKLSLDLKYLVEKQTIDSKNNIFLDQFNFGAKVESEDAIKAPMNLAVSLLKDPGGRISLDIPVKGDLDDPKFSITGIIVKMIVNLLVKAATSPFSLLGAMFGGGEDLNVIAFDMGSFAITSKGAKKVETLVKALTQRPGLNLEIAGYVNIDEDRSALADMKFEQRLKAEKLKVLIGQGNPGIPVAEIELTDEEYNIYLKAVFDQTEKGLLLIEQINKQKETDTDTDGDGDDKNNDNETADSDAAEFIKDELSITRDQMIEIIQKGIQVPDDELRLLASDRALTIKGAILADGNIDPKRVFIIEAGTLEPEKTIVPEGSEKSEESDKPDTKKESDKSIDSGSVILTLK